MASGRVLTRAQIYGELEYVFGSIKMIILVMTIMLLLIIDTMKREYPP